MTDWNGLYQKMLSEISFYDMWINQIVECVTTTT